MEINLKLTRKGQGYEIKPWDETMDNEELQFQLARYKSAALEAIMVSIYEDFILIRDRLQVIQNKQEQIEKLIAGLDK